MKKLKHFCLIITLVFLATFLASSCKSPGNRDSSEEKTANKDVIVDSIYENQNIPDEAGEVEGRDFEIVDMPGAIVYNIDCEKSKVEWFCGKHTGYVKLKDGINISIKRLINFPQK